MNAREMWQACCRRLGIPESTQYEAWSFGDEADALAAMVKEGIKTATASAYDLYALDGEEPLPREEEYSVILNKSGEAVCVIRTTRVTVVPFNEVTAEHAFREGESDRTLASWREIHARFFRREFAECGQTFDENRRIVCEEFEKIYG